MLYITKQEADKIIDWVNGFPMTYGDYLDNTGQEFLLINVTPEHVEC